MMEIIYVVNGKVSYTIENKKFTASPGDLIIIKPYSYHYFSAEKNTDYEKLGMLFSPSDVTIDSLTQESFLLLRCDSGHIHEIFNKIDFYFHNCPQEKFEELLLSLGKEVVLNVELFHRQNLITTHHPIHPMIERAIAHINAHLFTLNTVKELALALGVSEGYLKVLFSEQLKIPPKKYLTEKKMLMAKSMIEAGTPPTQTAFQCGYTNYVTFYRLYTKYFGNTPTIDAKRPL